MNPNELRRAMSAGIAFVVLVVVGTIVSLANAPNISSKDTDAQAAQKYVQQLSSSGHRAGLIIGAYLLVLAALAFVWFTLGLRARVTSVPAGRLIAGLGVLGASALAAAGMASASVAGPVSFGNQPVPQNGDSIEIVMDLTFPFICVVFALVSAALLAVYAVDSYRSGRRDWIARTAWFGVLGGVFAVIFIPLVLPLLWYLAVAITGVMRPAVSGTGAAERVAS